MKLKVKNLDTNEIQEINDTDLQSKIASGERLALPKGEYDVISPDGEQGSVPASRLSDAIQNGFKFKDSLIKKEERLNQEYGDNPIEALSLGAAEGLSFGASNYALKALGYPEERLREISKRNPVAHGIGEYGATLGAIIASAGGASAGLGGKILSKSAPGILSRAAGEVAEVATKNLSEGLLKSAANAAVAEGIEGAAYGMSDLASEAALGDAELNAENLISSAAMGSVLGSLTGGALGAGFKAASKSATKAVEKVNEEFLKLADKGDFGVLKWAGSNKRIAKNLLKTESLEEKEMSDYILDISKGFTDTTDSIVANNGITRGDEKLLQTISTSVEDLKANNQIVQDAAIRMMSEATDRLDQKFIEKYATSGINDSDVVFGSDLAKEIEEKFVNNSGGLFDPHASELQKFADELKNIGTEVLPDGRVARVPLTPGQLRKQSIIFGKLARFEKLNPTGKEDAYRFLRQSLEDKILKGMEVADASKDLVNQYKSGKKLFQKSSFADDMITNRIQSSMSNNRFSLTEGIAAAAGAAAAGPIGAAAGYLARKATKDYGDITVSAVLRKIQQRTIQNKNLIRNSAKQFFKSSGDGVNALLVKGVSDKDYEKSKDEMEKFMVNPFMAVNQFQNNNQLLFQVAPNIAEAAQHRVSAGIEFLKSKFPMPIDNYVGEEFTPSRSDVMKFNDYKQVIDDPHSVFDQLKQGYVNPNAVEALKVVYPRTYQELVSNFMENIPKRMTRSQKIQLQPLLGSKITPAMDYDKLQILQGNTPDSQAAEAQAQQQINNSVPTSGAKNLKNSSRNMSGIDKTIYRS